MCVRIQPARKCWQKISAISESPEPFKKWEPQARIAYPGSHLPLGPKKSLLQSRAVLPVKTRRPGAPIGSGPCLSKDYKKDIFGFWEMGTEPSHETGQPQRIRRTTPVNSTLENIWDWTEGSDCTVFPFSILIFFSFLFRFEIENGQSTNPHKYRVL